MAQSLFELLHDCTVRIEVPKKSQGTGFFVAPGLILTCAHVVEAAQKTNIPVEIFWNGQTTMGKIQEFRDIEYPDLTLLQVNISNHPCVLLHGGAEPFSELYSYGYPDIEPDGASTTFACEGWAGEQRELLKFKQGQVRPGMSGSPLLNRETGSICGIVQFTRDLKVDLGGKAMLSKVVFREFPQLEVQQKQFHQQDKRWSNLLTMQQRQMNGLLATTSPSDAFEIFYSYADEDEKMVQELQKQLILLKRRNLITDWHAGKIVPGEEPTEQIKRHLDTARIILLLVSPDFMFSEYHDTIEVKRAMERQEAKEAIVIPILLRPTDDLKDAPFGRMLAIPRNGKPISKWQDKDEAFAEVAREIRGVVEGLKSRHP